MWPTLFKIPWLDIPIRSYGMMLMIGFLGGTWWATRRASRVKADPDLIVNAGFVALLASIVGARIFYVAHYWENFAGRGIWPIIDVTAGGLEFYGGFIGGVLGVIGLLLVKRVSLRLYLDILAPSVMFGMSMARIGCFLNGCCWGGACPHEIPWCVTFPFSSPAYVREWENRQVAAPAELIVIHPDKLSAFPLPRDTINLSSADRVALLKRLEDARTQLVQLRSSHDNQQITAARKEVDRLLKKVAAYPGLGLYAAQMEKFHVSPEYMEQLANAPTSRTTARHPAQLYASLDGILLAILLNAVFYRRQRHGAVFCLLLMIYPFMRICEETIRSDNPHDTAGLTISQFVSLVIFAIGLGCWLLYRRLPLRSPRAIPWIPPEPSEKPQKHQKPR